MNIFYTFYYAFLLYLPAMIANMAPVIAAHFNLFSALNRALDFGMHYKGRALLGSHKTFRGLFVAIVVGACTGGAQAYVMHGDMLFGFFLGALMGFGAMAGDAIKSFFKRRMRIAPGSSWIPFDQIDFILGATLAAMLVIKIPLEVVLVAIIFIGVVSYVVSSIGFALHFKKTL